MLCFVERHHALSDLFLDMAEQAESKEEERHWMARGIEEARLAEELAAREWWRSEILEEAES